MPQKLTFKAKKISGIAASLFTISAVLEVVRVSNLRNKYLFPFYALTYEKGKQLADEWFMEGDYGKVADEVASDIQGSGLEYFRAVSRQITKEAKHFHKQSKILIKKIPQLNNQALIDDYSTFMLEYIRHYSLGAITFIYEQILSDRLTNSLATRYENAADILSTQLQSKYQSFLSAGEELLQKIKYAPDPAQKATLAEQYAQDFFYLKTNYVAAPFITAADAIAEAEKLEEKTNSQAKKVTRVRLTSEEKALIKLFKHTEMIRDQRKLINVIGSFTMFRFLDEVIKRTGIHSEEASNIFWFELSELLYHPTTLQPKLQARTQASMVFDGQSVYYLDYPAITPPQVENTKELRGTPACQGIASGKVRVVFSAKDFDQFRAGEIVVTTMTRPDFVPLLKKAAAIITDEGGLTSHAAIVSRELGIPCVVGTKMATSVLKDGDQVEVNASQGTITRVS